MFGEKKQTNRAKEVTIFLLDLFAWTLLFLISKKVCGDFAIVLSGLRILLLAIYQNIPQIFDYVPETKRYAVKLNQHISRTFLQSLGACVVGLIMYNW